MVTISDNKFTFDFDFGDEELDGEQVAHFAPTSKTYAKDIHTPKQDPFSEIPLSKLLDALPSLISYSPLAIPLTDQEGPRSITLARRDLYDARFQLLSEGVGNSDVDQDRSDHHQALEFLDAPSDLVPGVYEGGLKTWECSLDLVDYMSASHCDNALGKRVLEIGCGTAVPTLFLLHKLFCVAAEPELSPKTEIHVQDYNASAIELATMPNMILTWYMSPASSHYRNTLPLLESTDDEHPPADPSTPSNLPLSPDLKSAFVASLKERGINLRFFSGSWEGFDPRSIGGQFDIVITSETIYRQDGLGPLIRLMRIACGYEPTGLDEITEKKLTLKELGATESGDHSAHICLVAAKVLYFGVGGSINDFIRAVEGPSGKGKVDTVWEKKDGVGRKVMQVKWIK